MDPSDSPPTPASTLTSAPIEDDLRGEGRPIGGGLAGVLAALVQTPADLLAEANRPGRRPVLRLAALAMLTMLIVGVVTASYTGGLQLLVVPLKLCAGLALCGLLCLPSLYVFSSVAGAGQSLRETSLALAMGVALIGVLLVALAPVTWLFSQSTGDPMVVGTLHIGALLVSTGVGMRLVSRVIKALNGRALAGVRAWGVMFALVLLQMSTTLRPLVGPFEGWRLGERMFFLEHWADNAGAGTRR